MTSRPEDLGPAPPSELRVLIVDDTALFRSVLASLVNETEGTRVVAAVRTGLEALTLLEHEKVDLVVMDIEMPGLDGLQATKEIHAHWPNVGVVLVSGGSRTAAERTIQALAHGALDFVPKNEGSDGQEQLRNLGRGLRRCILTYQTRQSLSYVRRVVGNESRRTRRVRPADKFEQFRAVLIGASTGGPQALDVLVPALPRSLGVPVFVVQHMPPRFTSALARHLDDTSRLTVCEAYDGQPVEAGVVYVAPGGLHMVVRSGDDLALKVGLSDSPQEHNVRPCVDVLFRSAAVAYRDATIAVILTGMGQDGVHGVRALKTRGGYCIAESAGTAVIYGMPRAVIEADLADEVVELPRIADRIVQLLGFGANSTSG